MKVTLFFLEACSLPRDCGYAFKVCIKLAVVGSVALCSKLRSIALAPLA